MNSSNINITDNSSNDVLIVENVDTNELNDTADNNDANVTNQQVYII